MIFGSAVAGPELDILLLRILLNFLELRIDGLIQCVVEQLVRIRVNKVLQIALFNSGPSRAIDTLGNLAIKRQANRTTLKIDAGGSLRFVLRLRRLARRALRVRGRHGLGDRGGGDGRGGHHGGEDHGSRLA